MRGYLEQLSTVKHHPSATWGAPNKIVLLYNIMKQGEEFEEKEVGNLWGASSTVMCIIDLRHESLGGSTGG